MKKDRINTLITKLPRNLKKKAFKLESLVRKGQLLIDLVFIFCLFSKLLSNLNEWDIQQKMA